MEMHCFSGLLEFVTSLVNTYDIVCYDCLDSLSLLKARAKFTRNEPYRKYYHPNTLIIYISCCKSEGYRLYHDIIMMDCKKNIIYFISFVNFRRLQ